MHRIILKYSPTTGPLRGGEVCTLAPRLRILHNHIDFTTNCWATAYSLKNVAIDKASAYFAVIKYFRCLLFCHGLLLSFSSLSLCFPSQSHPPSHSTLPSHPPIHMQILGQIFEMRGAPDHWAQPLLSPQCPGYHCLLAPLASASEGSQWLIISAGQCSQL